MILDSPRFLAGLSVAYLACLVLWIAAGLWGFKRLLLARRRARTLPSRIRWINLGLSLWILLAGLTVVEMYFAFIYDQSDSFNMTNVSQRWFKRHVQTNPQGWRDDRPLDRTAPPGVHRVWFTGDSFTYGHGIKNTADRFSNLVAAALERQHPGEFAVSNVAEAGINIAQVENLMRGHLEKGYRFNTLVYVMCLNDIEPYVDERGERYVNLGKPGAPFFFRDTYFFNLLWFRLRLAMQPQVRNYYADLADAYHEGEPLRRFLRMLDNLHDVCSSHDVDLRVAIFPFLHNLGPNYPFAAAHRKIVDHCHEQRIPVLDLAPVLEPHLAEGLVVNRFDAHPNERAHQLAAEAMERELLPDLMKKVSK
ncbi:MAG TPA: SGNH/GDSL hydrolase family protein [Planctomycetaceae bacterium]